MTVLLSDRDWTDVVERYQQSSPIRDVILDDLLVPDAFEAFRRSIVSDPGWQPQPGETQSLFVHSPRPSGVARLAAELRDHLSNLLNGMDFVAHWAFMHRQAGGLRPHFDFGSVTINVWLTPDCYNQSPGRSGLILYSLRVPTQIPAGLESDWTDRYFRSHDHNEVANIAYRANRAVIFESALFHGSDEGAFTAADADSSRLNITMLFDLRSRRNAATDRPR